MQGLKPQSLHELETAVLFWAGENPDETLAPLKRLGIRCGQIGLRGDFDLSCASQWKRALQAANFTATAVCAAYVGEDYTDIPTVKRTVGFIPQLTRDVREKRTYRVIDFGAAIGVNSISDSYWLRTS